MADEAGGELLPVVGELAVIRHGDLRPGDVLVLSCLGGLTDAHYRRLQAACAELGITAMILEGGLEIAAILHKGE
jgi:hypothetical protein